MATPQDVSKTVTPVNVPRKPLKASSAPPVPEIMKQGALAPWLYLLPALVVMTFFIVYPMVNTIGLKFQQQRWYGIRRYHVPRRQPMLGGVRKLSLCSDSRIQHQLATSSMEFILELLLRQYHKVDCRDGVRNRIGWAGFCGAGRPGEI